MRKICPASLFLVPILLAIGCGEPLEKPRVAPRTAEDEIKRMPPILRERFDTSAGKKEMQRALDDKALLVAEARRRKLDEAPEIRTQVSELEERLIVQALLKEERAALSPTEDELHKFYDEHHEKFSLPERVHVGRVFVATRGDSAAAMKRAGELRKRLLRGEDLAAVAKDGDGAERVRGGDLGFVKKDHADRALAKAAFLLKKQGEISEAVTTEGGVSVLVFLGHEEAHLLPFEEARSDVRNHMQPVIERRAFDKLVERLRANATKDADH